MQDYEVNTIIENLPYLDRTSWEQNRFQVYSTVQMNSKKKLTPSDIMKFAWESKEDLTSITSNDIERLKDKAKEISNTFIKHG